MGCHWWTPARAQQLALAYNRAIWQLAARYGATVVDLYPATRVLWQPSQRGACFHLSAPGYAALAGVWYRVMHRAGAL